MKCAEAFWRYLDRHCQSRGIYMTEANNLKAAERVMGDTMAETVEQEHIDSYADWRLKGGPGHKPVKAATVAREITAIQAALNYCVKQGFLKRRRCSFTRPDVKTQRVLWLDERDELMVLDAAKVWSRDVELFTRMGLAYGVRAGALAELTWGQVDFQSRTIDFNAPGSRKTRKRRPVVPISGEIYRLLVNRPNVSQATVMHGNTRTEFRKCMSAAGYAWVTPHVLKHSAISLMLRGGARPEDVARLTATDLKTIMSVYRHHTAEELLEVSGSRRRVPAGDEVVETPVRV